MPYIWLILGIALIIIELATVNLVTIWFAAGAFAAFVVSAAGDGCLVQTIAFLLVSAILLALTRPLARKFHNGRTVRTNADSLIGDIATVTEDIDNMGCNGRVNVQGQSWAAKSADGSAIPSGQNVKIEAIEGVRLVVSSTYRIENS